MSDAADVATSRFLGSRSAFTGLGADRGLDLLREIFELGAPGHLARELVARDLCLGPRADEPV
jgi:hypothetical protein